MITTRAEIPRSLLLLGLALVAAECAGFWTRPSLAWGSAAWWALPRPWFFVSCVALVAIALRAGRSTAAPASQAHPAAPRSTRSGAWLGPIIVILAAAAFWTFRSRHLLLGDGLPLTSSVLAGDYFHPLEPLGMSLQGILFGVARRLAPPGSPPGYREAWNTIAVGSVAAGAAFTAILWRLCGEFTAPAGSPGTAAPPRPERFRALSFALLLSQGYVMVFFGYVENYAFLTAATAGYVLAALRFLHLRGGLAPVALLAALAPFLHLSGLALIPSFAWLAVLALRDPARRREALAGALAAGVMVALGWIWTREVSEGYSFPRTVARLLAALGADAFGSGRAERLSLAHGWAMANRFALVGPAGLWCFATFARGALAGSSRVDPTDRFLILLGGAHAMVFWLAGGSNLGYVRNWDLLACSGFVVAAAGLGGLVRRREGTVGARALGVAVAISAFHTVPWIAMNASEERAVRWYVAVSTGGTASSTIGYWMALRGRPEEAERWLRSAVRESPDNVRAHIFLGRLLLEQGRPGEAVRAYRVAARLHPDLDEVRLATIRALAAQDSFAAALPESEERVRRRPDDAAAWALHSIVLLGVDRIEAARSAMRRAVDLAPAEPLYARALERIGATGGPGALPADLRARLLAGAR